MRLIILVLLCSLSNALYSQSQVKSDAIEKKMEWFADAKLGIFIHEGIYAVDGVDESWSFHNKKIGYAQYMNQLKGFTLSKYDAAYWAELIKESGARYAVITTKHHDGVAMYDTKLNKLSSVKATPAKKDLITPFFAELRKRNIKAGAYYSLIDWSHPDYPGFLKDSSRYKVADDYKRWNRFRDFFQGQIREISTTFKPDCGGSMEIGNIVRKNGKVKKCATLSYQTIPTQLSTGVFRVMATTKLLNRIFL
jgi:alpha-L-fucosidase